MNNSITIVSGLPRSGASLMMKIFVNAGLSTVLDIFRKADKDNQGDYFEYEKVFNFFNGDFDKNKLLEVIYINKYRDRINER